MRVGIGVVDPIADRHVAVLRRFPFVGIVVAADDVMRQLVNDAARLKLRPGLEPIWTQVEIAPDGIHVSDYAAITRGFALEIDRFVDRCVELFEAAGDLMMSSLSECRESAS